MENAACGAEIALADVLDRPHSITPTKNPIENDQTYTANIGADGALIELQGCLHEMRQRLAVMEQQEQLVQYSDALNEATQSARRESSASNDPDGRNEAGSISLAVEAIFANGMPKRPTHIYDAANVSSPAPGVPVKPASALQSTGVTLSGQSNSKA